MLRRTGSFRQADRLLRPKEFQNVTRLGRRVVVRGFVLFLAAGGAPQARGARLGITVSRRVGKAIVRSRVKRRIREWFRQERSNLDPQVDLVVIGRRAAADLSSAEACALLHEGALQLGAVVS
jgi:ribonuclease P protein component